MVDPSPSPTPLLAPGPSSSPLGDWQVRLTLSALWYTPGSSTSSLSRSALGLCPKRSTSSSWTWGRRQGRTEGRRWDRVEDRVGAVHLLHGLQLQAPLASQGSALPLVVPGRGQGPAEEEEERTCRL